MKTATDYTGKRSYRPNTHFTLSKSKIFVQCSILLLFKVDVMLGQGMTVIKGTAEFRSCVKVKVAVLGSPSIMVRTVSVDVKQH